LSASDVNAVPTSRTINGKALSSNINLTANDVGAISIQEGGIPITAGGTGATDADTARENLGAAPSGYGLGTNAQSINSANSITKTGWYRTDQDTPNTWWWLIQHICYDNNSRAVQYAHSYNDPNAPVYVRSKNGGNWSSWKRLIDSNGGQINGVLDLYKAPGSSTRTYYNVASVRANGGSISGAIMIKMEPSDYMLDMEVSIYAYNSNYKLHLSGYTYRSGSAWYGCQATMLGGTGSTDNYITVRFGSDSSQNKCIIIGDTTTSWGGYLHSTIDRVTVGYNNTTTIGNWTMELITSTSSYSSYTIDNTTVVHNLSGKKLYLNNNGIDSTISSENSGFLHFSTDASYGFYFNKNIYLSGDVYAGSGYNQKLYGAKEMAWQKVSVSFSSGASGGITCSGVTSSSTVLAARMDGYGQGTGNYMSIGATASTSDRVQLLSSGSNTSTWTCCIWWSK
jgi:hypothetical protein